uniref:Proline--tRNA ligase n=1 Tax=Candidatus Aschnera chinzeii TaxID=1485666 RepID=A0AAT9G4U8_9ENTR|nr:MAG: proline--tRNA ligase [Candidatus Aschnera chinzeii]
MRTSRYLLSTLRENPADTKINSHQLMLRAGMIRKISSGIYNWLPTGMRVLQKIKNIIRQEMNRIGAIEISTTIIHPKHLWEKSNRLKEYGSELMHLIDRNGRKFILGPTNEEIISSFIRNEIFSYKQLPLNVYQIQNKFRDEIRPRYGIMRCREFIMKDAYSFHLDQESLKNTYNIMLSTYKKIFKRIGLKYAIVPAYNGCIGGNISHEFQVIAKNGEDQLVYSNATDYTAKLELVEAICNDKRKLPKENIRLITFTDINNIIELNTKLNFPIHKIIKTIIVKAKKNYKYKFIALLIRADHELNIIKAEQHPLIDNPIKFASIEEIYSIVNINTVNTIGPINLPLPIIIDRTVAVMNDFIAGANKDHAYYFGINWERDLPLSNIYDLRNVVDGDPSPNGIGTLQIKRSIEIAHIFQLGEKYSKIMDIKVKNNNKNNQFLLMGCYGIGISRMIAAIIEQNYDTKGIIWPNIIAPFQLAIIPVNIHKSFYVKELAEKIYNELQLNNIDVIIDDRTEQIGVMLHDMELIGIPHIIIISERYLDDKKIEYLCRYNATKELINYDQLINFLKKKIK